MCLVAALSSVTPLFHLDLAVPPSSICNDWVSRFENLLCRFLGGTSYVHAMYLAAQPQRQGATSLGPPMATTASDLWRRPTRSPSPLGCAAESPVLGINFISSSPNGYYVFILLPARQNP